MKPSRTPRCEHGNRHTKDDNGGMVITRAPMLPIAPTLCVECPLRRSAAPGYLGGYTPAMYIEAMRSGASLACHMTPGFQEGDIARQRHCTGVAAFRANIGVVAMVNGWITRAHDNTVLAATLPNVCENVFATEAEFVAHHAPGQVPQDSNTGDES